MFVKDYSKIVKVLNDLLVGHPSTKSSKRRKKQDKVPWEWGPSQQSTFDVFIHKLTSTPVLTYAYLENPS